ncbi:anthranilate synthase component I family protein [Microbacterium sp. 179-B 1A2 NHS]|uniref:anthranilate synthase component I family protein n=1 Tax=Microbacterium sp. 179-B 1A2 NHS TaxID=3142383 RepID=UPI0039A11DD3
MSSPLSTAVLPGWCDPAEMYVAGPGRDGDSFWLDAGPEAVSGWSWVGTGVPAGSPRGIVCDDDRADHPAGAAGPFRGGWIGWAGYDAGAERAGAPASHEQGPPERWLRVDRFLAFDHAERRVIVVAPADELGHAVAAAERWRAAARPVVATDAEPVAVRGRHDPAAYARLIGRCRDEIREGRAYQLCLTTRFETAASVDPVQAYLRLREATPSHHGGMIRIGDTALLSATPERFLEVSRGVVRTRPIKGTRPRGADPATDAALAAELRASEKEQAENVMIVDLMRNDLQRVCLPGSVAAERLLDVESYPAVHQLVSTVAGRLLPRVTMGALWDAAFPAGSMTGAPKLSAMQILHRLEEGPRGVFAGCFGWVGTDGAADLAMVIRSIVVHPDGAYVGAGGGITWGSVAADEVAEVGVKARGPLAALGAALPPGW